jgi:Mor family transcriptional regulator
MQSSTSTILAIVVAGILIFIVPLVTLSSRSDNVVQENVELIVEELDNNSLQESLKRDMLKLSGESLANMLGFGELYQKGKEKSIEEINENFYKILNKIN